MPLSASKAGAISSARRISSVADLNAERARRCLNLAHFQHGSGTADVGHDRQPAKTGKNLAQHLETLASHIALLKRQAGEVAARLREARDQGRCPPGRQPLWRRRWG